MSRKRRNTSSPETSPPPLRRRASPAGSLDYDDDDAASIEDPQRTDEKPRVSAAYGQTGAFPGLGGEDDDELFYGPALDGVDYLRMVRSEARGVPNLLVAPRDSAQLNDDAEEDAGGYWEDETYIAAPASVEADATSRLCAGQIRYYDSLLAQFRLLQATLKCEPPLLKVKGLGKERLISLPAGSENAREAWEEQMRTREPSMVQMASVDGESVWELVRLLGQRLEMVRESPHRVGAWVWAVLGRCPDRGICVSEEIGELRVLARRALALLEEEDESGEEGGAKRAAGHQDQMKEGEPWETSEMVLDMIITICGEVYGQRDLLEERRVWQRQEA